MRMITFTCFAIAIVASLNSYAQKVELKAGHEDCKEDVCVLPNSENGEALFGVVAPVGNLSVKMIKQAPRLNTLDGKTIALVGGSFNAAITHTELKRLILQKYPKAKVLVLSEVGNANQYYTQSKQVKIFQDKLRALKVDAVVSGNAGCGICTLKEVGNCIAAEYIGIPALTIGAPTFVKQIHFTSVNRGVPVMRTAVYPGAFSAHSKEELIANTKKVVFDQVIKGLTEPITEQEIASLSKSGDIQPKDFAFTGTLQEVNTFFQENRWSDGLPIVPPTIDKIEQFLKYTDAKWDSSIGIIPPSQRNVLVWHVAVNGVMAGCKPEFMPVLMAYTKALMNGNFRRPLASTHGWTPYGWLNGPISRQLGLDVGQGLINDQNNMAIGRFINLAMLNLGGYYVKENRMGTFGYLMPWFFAEDEEACNRIGWKPYHVQKGYNYNDNTITAGSALMWGNNLTPATPDGKKIMELIAWDITEKQQNALGATNPTVPRTIMITEFVARDLAKTYSDKEQLEDDLIKTARKPVYMRAYANYWANPGSQQFERFSFNQYQANTQRKEGAELTEVPNWLKFNSKSEKVLTVPAMEKGVTPIIVTGDRDRNKVQVMPGGLYATVKVELPKNWDKLMADLGYHPLSNFEIKPTQVSK